MDFHCAKNVDGQGDCAVRCRNPFMQPESVRYGANRDDALLFRQKYAILLRMQKDLLRKWIFCLAIALLLCACRVPVQEAEPTAVPTEIAETVIEQSAAPQTPETVPMITPTPKPTPLPTPKPTPTPTPTPIPTPTLTPTPTPIPTPTPTPTPLPTPFTFVWVSDTQTMVVTSEMRQAYLDLCDWVAAEAPARNFVLFLHTGDMVDDGDTYGQWQTFRQGVDAFCDRVPFFWALGNHDEGPTYSMRWKRYLTPDVPPEQIYEDGEAWYRVFEQGETRLLLLSVGYRFAHIEWTLKWAKEVCDAHPDLPVLLITHEYLTAQGGLSNRADRMEAQLVAACPNIRLVLCGHARGIARTAYRYDDDGDGKPDRTVNVLMYDTQTDRTRFGYVCLLTYDPVLNTLSCTSYSPHFDDEIYNDEAPEQERFTLRNVF
jgi:hypothetical protein